MQVGVSDPTCLQFSSTVTPKWGIPAFPTAGPIPKGQEFPFRAPRGLVLTASRQPSSQQQPACWPGGMVAGHLRRQPEGRSQLRRVSHIPLPDQGLPRKSRKKLQVIICVLLVELCERFTFFGIVCNMILFCTVKLGYDNYLAATVNLCFIGASTLTPVLVGWFAETCLGRAKVLYLCAVLHFFGKTQWVEVWYMLSDVENLKLYDLSKKWSSILDSVFLL